MGSHAATRSLHWCPVLKHLQLQLHSHCKTPHLQLVGFPESSLRRARKERSVPVPVCMRSSFGCPGCSRGRAESRESRWQERRRP